jgi:flavin-dependent dehydrogenase
LLEYLGVWGAFKSDGHLESYGTSAEWGGPTALSRDFLTTGQGYGWHLDRRRFDQMLACQVVERGGTLFTEARIARAHRDNGGVWRIDTVGKDGAHPETTASFVIDAGGKAAAFARRQGAHRQLIDRLVGVAGFYIFEDGEAGAYSTLVEACANGWWYSSVLPGNGMVATFLSDADFMRQIGVHRPEVWQALLAETQHTRKRLIVGSLRLPLQVRSAHSHLLRPTAGPGWIAAGEAAASFDPLAGMGLGHALSSGINAARVAHDLITSEGSLLGPYMESISRHFREFLELRQRHYRMERRWPDQPFWRRRHRSLLEVSPLA